VAGLLRQSTQIEERGLELRKRARIVRLLALSGGGLFALSVIYRRARARTEEARIVRLLALSGGGLFALPVIFARLQSERLPLPLALASL
jgi:hypothetical protein